MGHQVFFQYVHFAISTVAVRPPADCIAPRRTPKAKRTPAKDRLEKKNKAQVLPHGVSFSFSSYSLKSHISRLGLQVEEKENKILFFFPCIFGLHSARCRHVLSVCRFFPMFA
ncbi:hypothetical protein TW95_gp0204 [Pandoravirus inopinatum]|uniref:Uncharacterized protein n=1 Tax=Pandoravirus inopinatum TaxID=1605721 RepID=A0A0B5IW74_9VIRU|nr:hypothetical protein TW95_gp0204 [Pandoravirus inopinatum]AJF96938.1 hypothetical protein [Pandoravirus inopinatum]